MRWDDIARVDGTIESFKPGAFAECLKHVRAGQHVVELREGHSARRILASTKDATLQVHEAAGLGLVFEGELRGTAGEEAAMLIEDGFYRGASVGFRDYSMVDDGERTIIRATLDEISLVDRPAYKRSGVFLHGAPAPVTPTRKREPIMPFDNDPPAWQPRSFVMHSAADAIREMAERNRPRPERDGWGNLIIYSDAARRSIDHATVVVFERRGGGESTVICPPGDDGAFEDRVAAHLATIEKRAKANGGRERHACAATIAID